MNITFRKMSFSLYIIGKQAKQDEKKRGTNLNMRDNKNDMSNSWIAYFIQSSISLTYSYVDI